MQTFVTAALAATLLLAPGVSVGAQTQPQFPNHLVRIVVPFSSGSIADGFARVLSDKLSDIWKQNVIVENRPGIPGPISVATAKADGYTLMLTSSGHVIAKMFNRDLTYDPITSFVGVIKLAALPQVLVVPPDLPVSNLADFIALAKAKPKSLNFASNGYGSAPYMCAQVLQSAAKIELTPVTFRGAPEGITAVLRNDVQLSLTPVPLAQEMAIAGKVKPIALNNPTRNPQMPNLATVVETVPSFQCDAWLALLAPAGTPRDIVNAINAGVTRVLGMSDVLEKLIPYGAVPSPGTPEALDRQMTSETKLYGDIMSKAGVIPK